MSKKSQSTYIQTNTPKNVDSVCICLDTKITLQYTLGEGCLWRPDVGDCLSYLTDQNMQCTIGLYLMICQYFCEMCLIINSSNTWLMHGGIALPHCLCTVTQHST